MTTTQKVIKIAAIVLALALAVGIISSIVSLIGFIVGLGSSATNDEITAYEVMGDISSLNIEIGAADIRIEKSDSFRVESNLKHLTVKESNGTLNVVEKTHAGARYNDPTLTVFIPDGFVFEKLDITTGAGVLYAQALSARRASLMLGAGEVTIEELYASVSAEIEGGTGKMSINGGEICALDLSMGLGEMNISSHLVGQCDLELGVGETNLTLLGERDDYELELNRGIGNITVDGESVSSSTRIGNGENKLEIDGGIGSIHIFFKK